DAYSVHLEGVVNGHETEPRLLRLARNGADTEPTRIGFVRNGFETRYPQLSAWPFFRPADLETCTQTGRLCSEANRLLQRNSARDRFLQPAHASTWKPNDQRKSGGRRG